jgi:hypothetical protein
MASFQEQFNRHFGLMGWKTATPGGRSRGPGKELGRVWRRRYRSFEGCGSQSGIPCLPLPNPASRFWMAPEPFGPWSLLKLLAWPGGLLKELHLKQVFGHAQKASTNLESHYFLGYVPFQRVASIDD